MAASGQWHSTHMLLLGLGHLWKLPVGPTAEPLHTAFFISWLHSGNQGQFPFALGPTEPCSQPIPCSHAGKSIFLHLVNLVILPAPKDPLSPLEAGGSIGYFSFVLWCISTWSNILKHLFEQKRERKKRQVDIIKCHSPHKWLGFRCNVVRFLMCVCTMGSPRN